MFIIAMGNQFKMVATDILNVVFEGIIWESIKIFLHKIWYVDG